jgi:uncharacterized protein (DUF2235 family)
MAKNIVLCMDGTSNEFASDHTNVVKLCYAMVKDPARQLVYYHPGLGTAAPPGLVSKTGAFVAKLAGLAFGYGIKSDVSDAYAFIMDNYQPGDSLFIFGFSRGAYTAKAIASLIAMYGITMAGNEALVPYTVSMMWALSGDRDLLRAEAAKSFSLAKNFRATLAIEDGETHFLGLWDTVSSVGWVGSPVSLPYTRENPRVRIIRHAISIDEQRAFFRTNLVNPLADQDVKQVWFPGDHCDIGGGHLESESGLSKITFKWMVKEAEVAGLLIDSKRFKEMIGVGDNSYCAPDPRGLLHKSLTPWWWPAEFFPKRHWNTKTQSDGWRANLFRRRPMGEKPAVASTAWDRDAAYIATLPRDAVRFELFE